MVVPPLAAVEPRVLREEIETVVPPEPIWFPAPDRVDVVTPPETNAPPNADAPLDPIVIVEPPEPEGSDKSGPDFPQPSTTSRIIAEAQVVSNLVVRLEVSVTEGAPCMGVGPADPRDRLLAVDAHDALLNCIIDGVRRLGRHNGAFGKAAGPVGIAGATFAEAQATLLLERRVSLGQRWKVDTDREAPRLGISGLDLPVFGAVVLGQSRDHVECDRWIGVLACGRAVGARRSA